MEIARCPWTIGAMISPRIKEASTQSRCCVFFFFLKFRLPMGLHSSCRISSTASGTCQKCSTKYHDWVDAPQCILCCPKKICESLISRLSHNFFGQLGNYPLYLVSMGKIMAYLLIVQLHRDWDEYCLFNRTIWIFTVINEWLTPRPHCFYFTHIKPASYGRINI